MSPTPQTRQHRGTARPPDAPSAPRRRRRGLLLPSPRALVFLIFLSACFSGSDTAPQPPRKAPGPPTQGYLAQRHAFMLDTVVERPGRLNRYVQAQRRQEAQENLASFELVLLEQQRLMDRLRQSRMRGDEDFNRLLKRQDYLNDKLMRNKGYTSPRDRAAFARVLAEQRRILEAMKQQEAADVESFNAVQERRERLEQEEARQRRLAEDLAKARFIEVLLEQEKILLELERRRIRDDEFFFELQREALRHREQLERERLELEARFLERYGQPPPASR